MSKRNILKKNWDDITNELKERYPDLTEGDLNFIGGEEHRLVETVGKRRHITEAEAKRDVLDFLDHLNVRQRPPQ